MQLGWWSLSPHRTAEGGSHPSPPALHSPIGGCLAFWAPVCLPSLLGSVRTFSGPCGASSLSFTWPSPSEDDTENQTWMKSPASSIISLNCFFSYPWLGSIFSQLGMSKFKEMFSNAWFPREREATEFWKQPMNIFEWLPGSWKCLWLEALRQWFTLSEGPLQRLELPRIRVVRQIFPAEME